jgi:hypothetical protein
MPLESANFVQDLDSSNPPGSDDRSQGDNHLRLIKTALKATLPNASKAFRFPTSGATKTANFSVTFPTDQNVAFAIDSTAGTIAVSLPDPTFGGTVNEDGFGFWLIRTAGTNLVTVTPSGAQTIMGAASYSMAANRQYAYLFWAGTQDRWLVFEGNNPALTYGLQIATASETALIVRRTEDVLDTEYTLASWRLGSGVGAAAADTYVSGGANDVIERRRYIGATEIERLTTTLALYNILFGVGAGLRLSPDGYVDLLEIAAPANPAANTARTYAKDVNGVTLLAYRDSAGLEHILQSAAESAGALIAIIEDQKAQNTEPQTLTFGSDQIRELTTLVYNRDTLVSLSSNRFTLPAGTWEIEWESPYRPQDDGAGQSFLYNFTDTAEVARGTSSAFNDGNAESARVVLLSRGSAVVTIAASKAFEIRHRVGSTDPGGSSANFGVEVYTRVIVRRG